MVEYTSLQNPTQDALTLLGKGKANICCPLVRQVLWIPCMQACGANGTSAPENQDSLTLKGISPSPTHQSFSIVMEGKMNSRVVSNAHDTIFLLRLVYRYHTPGLLSLFFLLD